MRENSCYDSNSVDPLISYRFVCHSNLVLYGKSVTWVLDTCSAQPVSVGWMALPSDFVGVLQDNIGVQIIIALLAVSIVSCSIAKVLAEATPKLTMGGSTPLHKPSTTSISTHCPTFSFPSCGQPPDCLSYTVSSLERSSGANGNSMRSMVRLFVLPRTRSPSQVKRRGMISIRLAGGTSEPIEIRPFISVGDPISDTFNPMDCQN